MLYNNSSLLAPARLRPAARSRATSGNAAHLDPLGDERFGEAERAARARASRSGCRRPDGGVRPRGLRARAVARHLELAQPLDDRPRLRAERPLARARPTARCRAAATSSRSCSRCSPTFPDLALSVDDVYWMGNEADGYLVAVRWSALGTHRGHGVYGAADRPPGAHLGHLAAAHRAGRIVQEWTLFNEFDVLQQILRDDAGRGRGVSLAARLAAGDALTRCSRRCRAPAQVESAGHTGFDLVVLDPSTGPGGGYALEEHLRAADAAGLPALVRVPAGDRTHILARARRGRDRASSSRTCSTPRAPRRPSPPRTTRRAGGAGFARLHARGRATAPSSLARAPRRAARGDVVDRADRGRARPSPRADAILAVPGVSGVLIGAADLAMSLGHPPDAEIEAVIAAAGRAGVAAMTVVELDRRRCAVRACRRWHTYPRT